ncbi:putative ring finger protein [Eutypa lata UCREL1]|uniref:Putative ring finger protein n=1 Tax=Eutypa lata (strain UCR-EL1) TaxID=1287681 RepID=M7TY77_EUTLA|nr:putative ring finger protein [Eutypa lata UCREL1]
MFWRRSRHNRSDHHSRPSQPQRDDPPESRRREGQRHDRRIEITLEDLDAEISGRHASKIGIKKTSQLGHVVAFLKKRYAKGHHRIPPDARIEFYWDRERLDGDEIPKVMNTLSYRAYCEGDNGALRIDWSGSTLSLATGHKEQVESEVLKEGTVSSIRKTILRLLRESDTKLAHLVEDPLQIEICAGFNEEYIWHHPELDRRDCTHVRSLKQWLRREVLSVAVTGLNKIPVQNDDIRLLSQGKLLRDRARVRVGRTLDFNVTRTVENKFVEVEGWLLEMTEMCSVCSDDKRISEMPRKITASCTHPVTMCKECVTQWIASSLDTVAWDRLKCPECPELLRFEDAFAVTNGAGSAWHLITGTMTGCCSASIGRIVATSITHPITRADVHSCPSSISAARLRFIDMGIRIRISTNIHISTHTRILILILTPIPIHRLCFRSLPFHQAWITIQYLDPILLVPPPIRSASCS